jgi:hypothetical protein
MGFNAVNDYLVTILGTSIRQGGSIPTPIDDVMRQSASPHHIYVWSAI